MAFKGYQHPLSNHFPSELEIYDKTFKSEEHAYFYYMACEMGGMDLAEEIQEAEHAGKVKRLSKGIAEDTERWHWESENIDMREILEVKADQCEQFRHCLLENVIQCWQRLHSASYGHLVLPPGLLSTLLLSSGQARTCLELSS